MYAKHKWASITAMELAQKRTIARNDAWILFRKKKITEEEYVTLGKMASSPDVENLVVAIELIKAKNRKKKK
jgi:hypothetical protein